MVRAKPHRPPALWDERWSTPAAAAREHLGIRIITHNIRYAATDHDEHERPWKERCPRIVNELLYHTRFLDGSSRTTPFHAPASAGFICLQECLHTQLNDILSALNRTSGVQHSNTGLPSGPIWAHIGIGRDDGKTVGEYSPILYPTRVFELLHFENTWLSPTPDKPSKGWDAGSIRILTTGVFAHKRTGRKLAVFNTHLDNEGSESRAKSVPIILEVIERVTKDWAVHDSLDFLLAGDFNSDPDGEAYKALVASGSVVDVHDAVPKHARYGDEGTFTGFHAGGGRDQGIGRIDFVWVGPKDRVSAFDGLKTARDSWMIEGYSTLPNVFDDGVFCSDHRAVVADVVSWSK